MSFESLMTSDEERLQHLNDMAMHAPKEHPCPRCKTVTDSAVLRSNGDVCPACFPIAYADI